MAIKFGFLTGVVVLGLGCFACDEVEDLDVDDFGDGVVSVREEQSNDIRFNDIRFNDIRFNGFRFNSSALAADGTDSITLYDFWSPDDGYTFNGSLTGGELKINGWGGYNVEWSEFNFKVKKNGTTTWKYVSIDQADPVAGFTDVWEYKMKMQTMPSTTWEQLCLDPNGNPVKTLMIPAVYDTAGTKLTGITKPMTFACDGTAVAKCIRWGYRMWASKNGTSLADYHQACTRMVRADYCGNGTHHTAIGTPIHVLDQLGIQNVAPGVSYVVEAEWGPNGATCLNPGNTRLAAWQNVNVGCSIPTCGASFASGGLIQSGKIQ